MSARLLPVRVRLPASETLTDFKLQGDVVNATFLLQQAFHRLRQRRGLLQGGKAGVDVGLKVQIMVIDLPQMDVMHVADLGQLLQAFFEGS